MKRKHKPSQKGKSIRFGDVYSDNSAGFVYIDIEPKIVRQLMLTVKTLPEHTNQSKKDATIEMNKQIELFKNRYLGN